MKCLFRTVLIVLSMTSLTSKAGEIDTSYSEGRAEYAGYLKSRGALGLVGEIISQDTKIIGGCAKSLGIVGGVWLMDTIPVNAGFTNMNLLTESEAIKYIDREAYRYHVNDGYPQVGGGLFTAPVETAQNVIAAVREWDAKRLTEYPATKIAYSAMRAERDKHLAPDSVCSTSEYKRAEASLALQERIFGKAFAASMRKNYDALRRTDTNQQNDTKALSLK